MDLLTVSIIVFVLLESANVLMLYFDPSTTRGNGLGVFNAYEKSQSDPEVHALVTYLTNWVAGTKLIFIALLVVIAATGNELTKALAVAALILSISSYYWRLHPTIREMDKRSEITPAGYSQTLGRMIAAFLLVFTGALLWHTFA